MNARKLIRQGSRASFDGLRNWLRDRPFKGRKFPELRPHVVCTSSTNFAARSSFHLAQSRELSSFVHCGRFAHASKIHRGT
jgi:hypothetical protein